VPTTCQARTWSWGWGAKISKAAQWVKIREEDKVWEEGVGSKNYEGKKKNQTKKSNIKTKN
jgi:hypothetical protein